MNPIKKSCLVLIVALAVTLDVTAGGESKSIQCSVKYSVFHFLKYSMLSLLEKSTCLFRR